MLDLLREASRWTHVVLGFAGLAAFWFPVFARKGGRLHVIAGKVFAFCGYVVTITAVFSCCLAAIRTLSSGGGVRDLAFAIFLGYLGLATFTSLRHGMRVVATRKAPEELGTLFHRGLGVASIAASLGVVTYALVFWSKLSILLLAMSPIGWGIGTGLLRYVRRPPAFPRAWFYEHMGATLGAGIAFHTAFAVFGAGRFFGFQPTGIWGYIPWILPSAIGIPAGFLWERYYRRKLRDPSPREALAAQAAAG